MGKLGFIETKTLTEMCAENFGFRMWFEWGLGIGS